MAEEIKKIVTIDTKGAESVKDLIDKVEKLRNILKTLDETSDEYKSTLGELKAAQDTLTSSLGQNKAKAEATEGSYNALAQKMKELKKEWKATSDEAERNALGKEIKGINDQLKVLDQSIGNNQRNVGNYAGSFQALKQEIKEARDIMAGAAQGSDEYAEAAKRAAEATNQLKDMQQEIAMGSSGLDNKFAVMSKTLSSISGGFSAVQGAMALFGTESENLQKTFVKLQAAMSMTQGFKALAELPKALNAGKIAFGNAAKGVKTFITSLNGVKGAIAATGIGLLLVLLGELVANWDKVTEAVSNFVGGMDGLTEKLAGVGNVIKNLVTGPLKALHLALKGQWKEAGEAIKQSFSIAANYTEGAARQATKNTQKHLREQAEANAKELDYKIRMLEAEKGADFKYTEEGKKMYNEYFQYMLAQYDKNSDEYKEMLIKMKSFDREFTEHQKAEEEKRNQAAKQAAERAKQIAEQQRQEYLAAAESAYSAIANARGKERREIEKTVEEFRPLIESAFGKPPFKKYGDELLKNAKATLKEYKDLISEALNKAGLSYQGLLKTIETGNKAALIAYNDVLFEAEEIDDETFNRIAYAFQRLIDKENVALNEFTIAVYEDNKVVLDKFEKFARESVKKGLLNEGDWRAFRTAVNNIIKQTQIEVSASLATIAKDLKMSLEDVESAMVVFEADFIKAANDFEDGTNKAFEKRRDEEWKYSKEGQEVYEEYFHSLSEKYQNDFENWVKVQNEKAEYNFDLLKYQEDQQRKFLRRELANNLAQIDQYQEQLQRKADFDFWALAFGVTKEDAEKGFKEYEAMVKELDELTGTGHMIIPADATLGDMQRESFDPKKIEDWKSFWEQVKLLGKDAVWFIKDETIAAYDAEIAANNEYLANFIQGINIQIEELQKEMELETTTADEKIELAARIAEFEQAKSDETYQVYAKNKDKELAKAKKIEGVKKTLASNTASIFGSLSDYMSTLSDRNAETNEESARKQFEASKALGITETIISTLATVQGIIKSFSGMGPWGIAAGAVAGAAALASGMARVAQIRNQTFDSPGGDTSSSVGITSAVAVPQLESTPYQYTSNVTNAQDEDELNKPIIVQVSDVEDAMKVRESRQVETSF